MIAVSEEWAEIEALRVNLRIGGVDARQFASFDHVSRPLSGIPEVRLFVRVTDQHRAVDLLKDLNLLPLSS